MVSLVTPPVRCRSSFRLGSISPPSQGRWDMGGRSRRRPAHPVRPPTDHLQRRMPVPRPWSPTVPSPLLRPSLCRLWWALSTALSRVGLLRDHGPTRGPVTPVDSFRVTGCEGGGRPTRASFRRCSGAGEGRSGTRALSARMSVVPGVGDRGWCFQIVRSLSTFSRMVVPVYAPTTDDGLSGGGGATPGVTTRGDPDHDGRGGRFPPSFVPSADIRGLNQESLLRTRDGHISTPPH